MSQLNDGSLECGDLLPMSEWLENEKEGECRPCTIAVMIGDYQKILKEANRQDLAEGFSLLETSEDPVKAAADFMDSVKAEVGPDTRESLLLFDCMAQNSQQINKKEEEANVN
jgi:hypothetical protein